MSQDDSQIDEELYSRQIYVLGLEAMKRMSTASVLVSGMTGLGVEIAKNIILAGVKAVTVHDTENSTIEDLGSQFYLTEQDIGQNRAKQSYQKLAELNSHVTVSYSTETITDDFLKQFNTVVIVGTRPEDQLEHISEFCHSQKIAFIATETAGLFGYLFNDFGEKFLVTDSRGEIPSRFMIEYISHDEKGVVTTAEGELHNLTDGDKVRFEEVPGMTELNGKEFTVTVINATKFSIGDTTQFSEYQFSGSGGYGNQIIPSIQLKFNPLKQAITSPKVVESDFVNFGRDYQVITAFIAIHKYQQLHHSLPSTEEEIAEYLKIAADLKIVDELDESVIKNVANMVGIEISPMDAVFGGIVGQEVIKSLSGKFQPVNQFLAISYLEAAPSNVDYTPMHDRYDSYRKIFGNAMQERMQKLNYFMIGAGAIGCEILKNWAMMGVSTDNAKTIITDMDNIEKSNLSRQFLFRDRDIGHSKSECACKAAKAMNPSINLESHVNKLAEDTRNIYNDDFYNSLDGVCNALDNIEARLFSDKMCVYYDKPLLESGTLGPKASFQVVVPHITESYGSANDPEETTIPACTLHNFPTNMDHCCMWARDMFSGLFEQAPELTAKFLKDQDSFVKELKAQDNAILLQALETVHQSLIEERPKDYADCVKWARIKFEETFNWRIRDLLKAFPLDHLTETGQPFWSGHKRAPDVITFDATNPNHVLYIVSASNIRARIYGITAGTQEEAIAIAKEAAVPEWVPKSVSIDDDKQCVIVSDNDPRITKLLDELKTITVEKPVVAEKFEKDDDTNGHIDFITAASNLRATNYRIKTESRLEIKRLAGKIIPAIATTTAMVCGFICLEMYKVHSIEKKKLGDFRSGFINLAITMFYLSEPAQCPQIKLFGQDEKKFTLWDKIKMDHDMTIKELIDYFKTEYNLRLTTLFYGTKTLYNSVFNRQKKAQRMAMTVKEAINDVNKEPLPEWKKSVQLDVMVMNQDLDEVQSPPIMITF